MRIERTPKQTPEGAPRSSPTAASRPTASGPLGTAISNGDEEECYRLGRRVSEALRLVVEGGLGWRERTAETTVLNLPDEEIRRTVRRMERDVRARIEYKRPEHEENQAEWDRLIATKAACQMRA